jgi:transposase InsO family protein
VSAKFACIAAHRADYPVALMCRVLAVSPAGFYAAQRRPPSARAARDEALRVKVRAAHAESRRCYGAPRVHHELHVIQGEPVSRKRVARLMKADGLRGRPRRRAVRTTDSAHGEPVAPNTLARQFAVDALPACDRVWTADITYLPTREGWLYLAVLLDRASRRVVGWALRETLGQELAVAALRMALTQRRPAPGGLHHSDRGSQYAAGAYRGLLAAHGFAASMSRRGDCWDNAVTESFFATLKTELVHAADWATRDAARAAIFEFIEVWYNRRRRHSSLGYRTPVEYEEHLARGPAPARSNVRQAVA